MLLQLAWRNVWRNKTRSLVILTAVVIGLWGGIFSDAFMQGMSDQQIYSSIHTETGHLQINEPGFLLNHDMQLHIDKVDSILSVVKKMPEVQAAAARIQLPAMATTASSSAGIMVNGIDPPVLSEVSDVASLLVQGDYFKGGGQNQVVIGKQLAEKLKVKLHSRIILTLQTIDGDIIYGAFKVEGIYRSHDSDYDKEMIFVRNNDLRPLINFPEDAASIITVLLRTNEDTKKVATRVKNEFPNKQVQTWIQLSPMLQLLSGTIMQMTIIFVGIILIALAFGIINTMLMAVMDRTREIGMLLSVGMKPSKVFAMIMLETIFLCLTGAIIGVIVSMATVYWFGKTGINLAIIAEGINALGYSSVVYPALRADFYVILSAMVIVIALVAGIFPARKAIRLRPAEALRGD
jgi:ABC-type lipoprotein release transport system permease subunit